MKWVQFGHSLRRHVCMLLCHIFQGFYYLWRPGNSGCQLSCGNLSVLSWFTMFNSSTIVPGLNRSAFDNKTVSFEEHTLNEHNMWHYLYFIVLVRVKDPTEFTGPESYVYAMVKVCIYSFRLHIWYCILFCSTYLFPTFATLSRYSLWFSFSTVWFSSCLLS